MDPAAGGTIRRAPGDGAKASHPQVKTGDRRERWHAHNSKTSHFRNLIADLPKNWGRWGDDDEIGCLNYQTPDEVLRGVRQVRSGKVFTLGLPMGRPGGDPVWPGRSPAIHLMTQDRSYYTAGKLPPLKGGLEYADDYITGYLQGSSQYDALGHTWYDGQLYNGFPAETTTGGMAKCGVDKIARRGVVGRGVLIDMAQHRGKDST